MDKSLEIGRRVRVMEYSVRFSTCVPGVQNPSAQLISHLLGKRGGTPIAGLGTSGVVFRW